MQAGGKFQITTSDDTVRVRCTMHDVRCTMWRFGDLGNGTMNDGCTIRYDTIRYDTIRYDAELEVQSDFQKQQKAMQHAAKWNKTV
jgi:hypothetical protein